MYKSPVSPTQIQQYRLQNPASFQRSDEDIASMINNASSVPSFSRTATQSPNNSPYGDYNTLDYKFNQAPTQPPKQPSTGQQIKDAVLNQGSGILINEGAKEGLTAAGVEAGDIGGYLAAAKGVWGAGKVLGSDLAPKDKAREARQQAENAAAGYFTGGISSLAQLADQKLLGGKLEGVRDAIDKVNPLNPVLDYPLSFASKKFGSSKGKEQQQRDQVRQVLQKGKFLDPKWGMTLADNSTYDIGRDGGAKDESGLGILEMDFTNSKPGDLQSVAIGNVNPLAAIITGGNKKLATDFATYFTKGTMSNANGDAATVRANAIKQYSNAGLDKDKAIAAIADLEKQGKVTTDDATAYKNGISMLFGGGGSSRPASQGDRGAASSSRTNGKPKSNRRPSNSGNTNLVPVSGTAPVSLAPTVLAPTSTTGYNDNFAQSMANIYSQNQG